MAGLLLSSVNAKMSLNFAISFPIRPPVDQSDQRDAGSVTLQLPIVCVGATQHGYRPGRYVTGHVLLSQLKGH